MDAMDILRQSYSQDSLALCRLAWFCWICLFVDYFYEHCCTS